MFTNQNYKHIYYLFFICFFYSLYYLFLNIDQPLLENHAFRQTQTAITSFYLKKDGFSLSYETPVLGYPWSIPFEFPIYQYIVSLFSKFLNLGLDFSGRFISTIFFYLILFPSYKILRIYNFSHHEILLTFCLVLTSPFYLFWSSTFLIETAALFFTLMSFYYLIAIYKNNGNYLIYFFAFLFSTLAMLQKITTAFPLLLVMGMLLFSKFYFLYKKKQNSYLIFNGFFKLFILFVLPSCIAYIWVIYSDSVKSLNFIASTLTSSGLSKWNYGTWSQLFSFDYISMIGYRVLFKEGGYGLSLFIILISFFKGSFNDKKRILFLSILFFLPFIIFTNLHRVHTYYQVSNMIFFILLNKKISTILYVIFIFINIHSFHNNYKHYKLKEFSVWNNKTLQLADFIKSNTIDSDIILIYGYDWSSELAYYAERKSLTNPGWNNWDLLVFDKPEQFFGNFKPKMIINCPNKKFDQIKNLYLPVIQNKYLVSDCEIYLVQKY